MSFDLLVVAGLIIFLIFGGMRLLYGAWPWEGRKTWYHTRPAVEYLAALRREHRDRELHELENTFNATNDRFAGSVTPLRQVADDASADHFDRSSMVHGNSLPKAATLPEVPPAAGRLWPVHPNSTTGL